MGYTRLWLKIWFGHTLFNAIEKNKKEKEKVKQAAGKAYR
jgi:hypothetical protein